MVIICYGLPNFQPGKVSIINFPPSQFAPHSLNFPFFFDFFYAQVLKIGKKKKAVRAADQAAVSESRARSLGLHSRGMEVSRAREALASHRLPGQKGLSSPRIPPSRLQQATVCRPICPPFTEEMFT